MGEDDLGLVGDRQVGLAGGDQLQRRRRDRRGSGSRLRARLPRSSRASPPCRSRRGRGSGRSRASGSAAAASVLSSSDFSPQAASASASSATARAIAGIRGNFIPCVLSPSDDASLERGQEADQRASAIAERMAKAANMRAVSSWALSWRIRWPSPAFEPAHSAKRATIGAKAAAILAPLKSVRERGRRFDPAEDLPARGVEGAHHLDRLGVDGAQPVERGDRDREEADERDDRELRPDPVAEPDDEDRRDARRSGPSARRRSAGRRRRGASSRGAWQTASAMPARIAQAKPEEDLLQGHPGVFGQQRAVLPERLGDFGGGGDEERFEAEGVGEGAGRGGELPGADQRRAAAAAGRSQRLMRGPRRRAWRACSRTATKAGSVTASVAIGGARGGGARSSATTARRPWREDEHAVGEVERLLDVVGDQEHGARVAAQRPRQPLLHLGAGDRVERGEGLVERPASACRRRSVRRKATRCRIPPESSAGRAALEAGEAEALEQRAGLRAAPRPCRRRGCAAPAPRCRAPRTRGGGGRAGACRRSWASRPAASAAPSTAIVPALGSRRPQTSSSRVDLPQPEGPTRPTTSCSRDLEVEPSSDCSSP